MSHMYDINVTFMEMYSLIQSVPYTWKCILRIGDNETMLTESWFDIALKGHKISKDLYWFIISRNAPVTQGSMLLWSQDFNKNIQSKEWSGICCCPWKITLCSKLRLFQYKIVQRCLVTNVHLFYYKVKESKNCTFCKSQTETIMHLFWDCPNVCKFWEDILKMLKIQFNNNRLLLSSPRTCEKILLNTVVTNLLDCINLFVLVAKRYIYITRCKQGQLNPQAFIGYFLKFKEIEKFIAVKNRKLEQHELNWAKFTTNNYL